MKLRDKIRINLPFKTPPRDLAVKPQAYRTSADERRPGPQIDWIITGSVKHPDIILYGIPQALHRLRFLPECKISLREQQITVARIEIMIRTRSLAVEYHFHRREIPLEQLNGIAASSDRDVRLPDLAAISSALSAL